MRRLSDEAPKEKEEKPDPAVEVHASELASLRRKATLGTLAFGTVFVLVALIVVGIVVNQQRYAAAKRAAEGKEGAITKRVEALASTVRNLSEQEAQRALATEQQNKDITAAQSIAARSVAIARETASEIEPITEQLDTVEGQFVILRTTMEALATADSVQTVASAQLRADLGAFRTQVTEQIATVLQNTDAFGRRLELAEQRVDGFGKHQTVSDVLNAMLHGVSIIHIAGTKGQ